MLTAQFVLPSCHLDIKTRKLEGGLTSALSGQACWQAISAVMTGLVLTQGGSCNCSLMSVEPGKNVEYKGKLNELSPQIGSAISSQTVTMELTRGTAISCMFSQS